MRKNILRSLIIGPVAALTLSIAPFVVIAGTSYATAVGGGTIHWTGQGADSVKACSGDQSPYLHWIFTTGGNSSVTSATLTVSGDASGGGAMSEHGGSWTINTSYSGTGQPTTSTVTASVAYVGSLGRGNSNLVISDGCYGSNNEEGTGSITVIKHLDPVNDPGLFNLNVGDDTVASNVGNNGQGTASDLKAGTYVVSETAGTNTNLSNYTSSVTCTNDATGTTSATVRLTADEDVTCTFTNTIKAGQGGGPTMDCDNDFDSSPATECETTTGGQGGGTVTTTTTTTPTTGGQGAGVATTPTGGVNAGEGTKVTNPVSAAGMLASLFGVALGLRRVRKTSL